MKTRYTVALSMLAGTAAPSRFRAFTPKLSGKHSLSPRPKCSMPRHSPRIAPFPGPRPMLPALAGFPLREERLLHLWGEAPKRVGIQEWESLEKAQAFRNSDAFKKLTPQRDKAVKTIRSYAVEAN
jgi:hypothetical protein